MGDRRGRLCRPLPGRRCVDPAAARLLVYYNGDGNAEPGSWPITASRKMARARRAAQEEMTAYRFDGRPAS